MSDHLCYQPPPFRFVFFLPPLSSRRIGVRLRLSSQALRQKLQAQLQTKPLAQANLKVEDTTSPAPIPRHLVTVV